MIRQRIEDAIKKALENMGVGDAPFVVERPGDMDHGDYATNAALAACKMLEQAPRQVAEELAGRLKIEGVEKIEIAGPGFINFFLGREALIPSQQTLPQPNAGKSVLIEYTSPNLFKPLHIGNLVGNILGESLARLFERTGASVVRINYPSDIGLTVAKGVWGLTKLNLNPENIDDLGKAYVAGNEAYESGSAKSEIDAINKALYEDSNPEWSALRKKGIETSRKHLDDLCAKLGTKFDKEFFESDAGPIGRDIVQQHVGEIFEESEGAVVYRGEQDGLHTRVFLNSQGLPTYEAKDLGLLKLKLGAYPDFDVTITDTGPEQIGYFEVLYAVARKVFPELGDKTLLHTAHGYLKLTTGKMSSRLGNVITGESLLEDVTKEARGREDVAVGALKYTVLKSGAGKDIVFDPDKSLSLEGDSGPYVQYARTRAGSLLREAAKAGIEASPEDAPKEASSLERLLIHYPDALVRAAQELEPHHLTTFLTELASEFNSWYAHNRVIGGIAPHFGVMLTAEVERILREGLETLGIPAPEEM